MENSNLTSDLSKIIASSPGKVLVCGGYLVINPNYSGLVFNTNTNIQTTCEILDMESDNGNKNNSMDNSDSNKTTLLIKIHSKNFGLYYKFNLSFSFNTEGELEFQVTQIREGVDKCSTLNMSEKYIYYSIMVAANFFILKNMETDCDGVSNCKVIEKVLQNIKKVFENGNKFLNVTIEADYRFYTYNKENFSSFENNKNSNFTVKTGLGSSSALTCSLVTSLFIFLNTNFSFDGNCEVNSKTILARELNIQISSILAIASFMANNMAQNKIGSGFDIQSCLLGSQIFNRIIINEKILNSILNLKKEITDDYGRILINDDIYAIYAEVMKKYEENVKNIKYFPSSKIFGAINSDINISIKHCLISIECGSDTRILVPKVMKWAEANKKLEIFDDEYFQKINQINQEIIEIFLNSSPLNINLIQLKEKCFELRQNVKILSKACDVEIEPDILTNLMDRLMSMDNIIFAVCPGAGGYDSIFVMGIESTSENSTPSFDETVQSVLAKFNDEENVKAYPIPVDITDSGTIINILK